MNDKQQQLSSAVQVIAALAEAIRQLGQIPSGHLYAQVMNTLSLDDYHRAIDTLKRAELVAEAGDVLRWVGPVF